LPILKQRMYQGKLNEARRGELVVSAPAGYVKSPAGRVAFDPDEQAQDVIRLVFDLFDRRGAVHGVLRAMIDGGVRLPVRRQSGADRGRLDWRAPCRETVRHILRHPMYAGAYRYGFRPTDPRHQTPGHPRSGRGSGPAAEDGLVFLRDRHPAYITWERFESTQARLTADRSRAESAGAVRGGAALLAGVVWCGRCGKRMYVRCGAAGPAGGRRTCAAPCGLTTACRCASRRRRPRSSPGWPSRSWRRCRLRSWTRASARRPRSRSGDGR